MNSTNDKIWNFFLGLPGIGPICAKAEANGLPRLQVYLMLTILIVPLLASMILTELQIYPATIGINLLVNDDGTFPLMLATVVNWAIFVGVMLIPCIPISIIGRLILNNKK